MFRHLYNITVFLFFTFCCSVGVTATTIPLDQTGEYSQSDTLKSSRLDSLVVISFSAAPLKNRSFMTGTKVQSVSELELSNSKAQTLSDYLKESSPIYIKEYGRGMGSFISIRGTSSSHTSIVWNGMDLSVPTMGQADLSHVPLYFFDNMDIHVGGGSALYGNGSIGGSIQLSTQPKWREGWSGDAFLSMGSYSTYFGGSTVRYSNSKIESRSSLYYSGSENNFSFINNTKPNAPKERQNNAQYSNWGLLQEVNYRAGESGNISFNIWYLDFDREIQPSVSSNDRPESYASIYDNNLRTSLTYSGQSSGDGGKSSFLYSMAISYSHDKERYKEDVIESSRYKANANIQYSISGLTAKTGVSYESIVPTVDSYMSDVNEKRSSIYLLMRYGAFNNAVIFSGGVRGGSITNSSIPLMPSLGATLFLHNSFNYSLSLRSSLSKSVKVPTLNDRYWGGVHKYLKNESSVTAEGGLDFSLYHSRGAVNSFITLYRSSVDNWIRWFPAGQVWRPQNIPHVVSKGIEFGLSADYKFAEYLIKGYANYNYVDVKTIKALWQHDPAVGKQLAYQPRHRLTTGLSVKREKTELFINGSYTGERTTMDIYDRLDSYILVDSGVRYSIVSNFGDFNIALIVKNIFNKNYQNIKFYAMPGTNWQINLKYNF